MPVTRMPGAYGGGGVFRSPAQRKQNPGVGPMQDAARRRLGMNPGVFPARSTAAPPPATADTGMVGPRVTSGPLAGGITPPSTGGIAGGLNLPTAPPVGGIGGAAPVGISPMSQAAQRYGQNQTGNAPAVASDPVADFLKRSVGRFTGSFGTQPGGYPGGYSGYDDPYSGRSINTTPGNPNNPPFGPGYESTVDLALRRIGAEGRRDIEGIGIGETPEDAALLEDIRRREMGNLEIGLPGTEESPELAQLYESLRQQSIADANNLGTNLAGTINSGAASRGLLGSGINIEDLIQSSGGVGRQLQSQLGEYGRQRLGNAVERRQRREDYMAQAAENLRSRLGGLEGSRYGAQQGRRDARDNAVIRQIEELSRLRSLGRISDEEYDKQRAMLERQGQLSRQINWGDVIGGGLGALGGYLGSRGGGGVGRY